MDWGDKITPSFGFGPRGVNAVCGQALPAVYNRAYSHRFILYIEHFHLLLWHCSHLKVSPAEQSTDCRGWSCFRSSAGRQLRRQTDTWKPQICLNTYLSHAPYWYHNNTFQIIFALQIWVVCWRGGGDVYECISLVLLQHLHWNWLIIWDSGTKARTMCTREKLSFQTHV